MHSLRYFLFAFVLATAACASSPVAPTEPAVVTLAPGDSTSYGSLKVKFVRVTADSRCPGDAICIQAGDAQAAIEISGFGPSRSAELYLVAAGKRSTTYADFTITFEALSPYPFLSQGPISPGAYRATFRIARK
jgi:hypothetical protein